MDIHEKKIKIENPDFLSLLAYNEEYLYLIENKFNAVITLRGENLILKGNPAEIAAIEKILNELKYMHKRYGTLKTQDVVTVIELVDVDLKGKEHSTDSTPDSAIYWGVRDVIKARNPAQLEYFKKVLENDLVFSIGPAGTGKTFLAVAMALAALKNGEVSKIILSRPAVEAGESLGFLPGDLKEKLDPYIRPLTDALFYMLNPEKLKNMMEKNIIEITPLAYMRGRTLNNSFIILDEAQNATVIQMKMFLTRMGSNSKAIVTGDITQIDLPNKENCGLIDAVRILKNIEGIEFVYFTNKDVVRHRLVAEIVRAYEKDTNKHEKNTETEIPDSAKSN